MSTKRLALLVPLVLAAAVALAGCGAPVSAAGGGLAAQASETASPRVITVSGSGSAMGAPDVAYITLGVEARDPDAAAAVADATERMSAVMEALTEAKVDPKDVQTVSYQMWLEQTTDPKGDIVAPGTPSGTTTTTTTVERYHVVNQVRITVRALENVGTILQDALTAGANSVADISFAVEDATALQREARDGAIANAKAKADQLAAGLGAKIGAVQSVSEYTSGPQPIYATRNLDAVGGMGSVPVSAGQLSVSVEIQVSFLIVE